MSLMLTDKLPQGKSGVKNRVVSEHWLSLACGTAEDPVKRGKGRGKAIYMTNVDLCGVCRGAT